MITMKLMMNLRPYKDIRNDDVDEDDKDDDDDDFTTIYGHKY